MEKLTFTKKEFKILMEVVATASKDNVRPILQCINFNSNEVVSLDGYRLKIRKHEQRLEGNYNIHKDDIKALIKEIKSNYNTIEFQFNNDYVSIWLDSVYVRDIELKQGNYINYKSLLPQDFKTCLTRQYSVFNSNTILDIINKAKCTVILDINKEGITIQDHSINWIDKKNNVYEVVQGLNINSYISLDDELTGDNIKIAFNSKYLKDALKDYKKSNCNIKFVTAVSPCLITDNENRVDLVLPVRIVK